MPAVSEQHAVMLSLRVVLSWQSGGINHFRELGIFQPRVREGGVVMAIQGMPDNGEKGSTKKVF